MSSRKIETPPRIGRYTDLIPLGKGGMGVVYRARDPELGRFVAVKLMLHANEDLAARFRREAQAVARLQHPNVIQVFDIGTHDEDRPYFVMELIEGESLDRRLERKGRIPPLEAIRILHQAAEGLGAAHRAGIIHRDIKPSNLMIDALGRVKLLDFGIAHLAHANKLTETSTLLGTPSYMAPEQVDGRKVDQRADIYALGLTLFEMLAGQPAFYAENPLALAFKQLHTPLPDLRQLEIGIPEPLVRLVEQMTAKDPAERIARCEAVIAALDEIEAQITGEPRRPPLGLGAEPTIAPGSVPVLALGTEPTMAPGGALGTDPTMAPGGALGLGTEPTMAPGGALALGTDPTMAPGSAPGVSPRAPTTAPDRPQRAPAGAPATAPDRPPRAAAEAPVTAPDRPQRAPAGAPVTAPDRPPRAAAEVPVTAPDRPPRTATDASTAAPEPPPQAEAARPEEAPAPIAPAPIAPEPIASEPIASEPIAPAPSTPEPSTPAPTAAPPTPSAATEPAPAASPAAPAATATASPPPALAEQRRPGRTSLPAIGIALALVAAAGGGALWLGRRPPPTVTPNPTAVTQAPPAAHVTPPARSGHADPPPAPPKPDPNAPLRIVILDFANISRDPELASLSRGIGETTLDVIHKGAHGRITLIERGELDATISQLDLSKDTEHFDPAAFPRLGKLLGAPVAVQGAFQRAGQRVRVTARFIRLETGEILGTLTVDGAAGDVFRLQDEVAGRLVRQLLELAEKLGH